MVCSAAQLACRQALLRGWRQWSQRLRRRRPATLPGTCPDWLDAAVVNGLWLDLTQSTAPRLGVAVRDGVPLSGLPTRCRLPGCSEPLTLHRVRAPRAQAQLAPELRPSANPGLVGSATALLRRVGGTQAYLLTCAHVAAPGLENAFGAQVNVSHSAGFGRASITDWRPALSAGPAHSTMDAALLAIGDDLALALRRDGGLLPAGIGDGPRADQRVTMRSHRGEFAGSLKVHWAGPVDVPGFNAEQTEYFLDAAIGYCCASRGGDSGAAIWDAHDQLMGMHIAGLDGVAPGEVNAVYGPIRPVLDAFAVSPWLKSGIVAPAERTRASSADVAVTRTGSAPGVDSTLLSERQVVACTLWGEARNQGEEGMRAVAGVIANRWRSQYRRCQTAQAVCLDPRQFSCWLKNDPNQPRMLAVARQPDAPFGQALGIADELLQRTLGDTTRKARHYYAMSMPRPPTWARGKFPCVVIREHLFFNDID